MTSYKENKSRPRDARGRFIKAEPAKHEITEKELTRMINKIADGDEPTLESVHDERLMREFIIRAIVTIVSFAVIVLCMWLFQGCTPQKEIVYVPSVKTVTVETIVHDTIIETKLDEQYAERETRDTTSHLSNKYAYSDASISGGVLHHTLGIHPGASVQKEVQTKTEIITLIDSIPYPVEVKEIEYVERKLNFIEKFLMGIGVIALLGLALWIWKR